MPEITLIKRNHDTYTPATETDREIGVKWKIGQGIKFDAVKHSSRSLQHHKLYWGGLIELAFHYWEPEGGLISESEVKTLSMFANWLDDIFAKLVKIRANHYCEATGEYYENDEGLDCSHVFSRGNMATRWHPKNAYAHGREFHRMLTDNPMEHEAWCRGKMGDEEYEALQTESRKSVRIYDSEKEELLARYKSEYKRIKALRDQGFSGRIEFK